MSNLSEKQILSEFRRQVFLCGGLGRHVMLDTVNEYFDDPSVADMYRDGPYSETGKRAKWQS